MPKVSVITVCYNAENKIEKTIQSVLQQTFLDYEYIIVDGASTDHTMDIVEKYSESISKVISEPDRGVYDAMNKGVKAASGEWLIMMNSGDYFSNADVLKNVFDNVIPEGKNFIYSDVYGVRTKGQQIRLNMSWEKGRLIHQSVMYRKSLHEEHGFYIVTKPLIVSDYLFFIRIPREEVMKITNTVIAVYEGGGVSAQGLWALQQSICADVVFRRRRFWEMLRYYVWKRLKGLFPSEMKNQIKMFLGEHFCTFK